MEDFSADTTEEFEIRETEEVTSFAEIMPITATFYY
jgi:hypothetical protein